MGSQIKFLPHDSIRNFSRFDAVTFYEKKNILSSNPVDILSFDNIFLATDIDQGMIFKSRR